jgi:hypothetical protein
LSDTEINRPENIGLSIWRNQGLQILRKYEDYEVEAADFAQFAHNVAAVVCPLGPRTLTLVGRDSTEEANPENKLPNITSPADVLIKLFNEKSTSFVDLVALIGAHTVANQFFVNTSLAGQPFDSTPGIWDVKFYQEVVAGPPPPGVFRLPSDDALNGDNTTHSGFVAFADPKTGQALWNNLYSKAFVRMSLFGVDHINQLADCTHVLPSPSNLTNLDNTCTKPSSSAIYSPEKTSHQSRKHKPNKSHGEFTFTHKSVRKDTSTTKRYAFSYTRGKINPTNPSESDYRHSYPFPGPSVTLPIKDRPSAHARHSSKIIKKESSALYSENGTGPTEDCDDPGTVVAELTPAPTGVVDDGIWLLW